MPDQLLGRQQYLGYAKEVTRGTPVTTATKFFSFANFKMEPVNEYFDDQSAFGRREAMIARDILNQSVKGNYEDYIDPDDAGQWFLHTFGQAVSAQPGSLGAYTHTFAGALNQVDTPTFTLQYSRSKEGILRSSGVGIKTLELDVSDKNSVLKTELIGIKEEAGDVQTVALAKPARPLYGKNMTCKYASSVAGLGAGTELKIRKFNTKIETGLDFDPAFGSLYHNDTFAKSFTAEVGFSAVVRTDIFNTNFKNNTKMAWEFDANATNLPVLGTSSLFPRLRVRVPPSSLEITHETDIDNEITFDGTIKCEYSFVDSYLIEILLQNTTPSY